MRRPTIVSRAFWLVKLLGGALFLVGLLLVLPTTATAQMLTRSNFSTFPDPVSVVAGDFNHDGMMDFAVSCNYFYNGPSGIEVYLGNGDGTFNGPTEYRVANGTGPMAMGDLNHDGNPDLVTSSFSSDAVLVLLGNADGTFRTPVSYSTPSGPWPIVLGDFNNDGILDIASGNQNNDGPSIGVLLGNGDGTFREPAVITYPPFSLPEALAAGNFNGDKNLDLALTLGFISSATAQILLGNGDGTFTLGASYTLHQSPSAIIASDLRNNGKTDLVVTGLFSPGLAVLLNDGDGTFQQPVYYAFGGSFSVSPVSLTVAAGDMNGDRIPDLVAATTVSSNAIYYSGIYIFPGKGDGTFGAPGIASPVASNSFPNSLALADFNGDHQLDVTFSSHLGYVGARVLLNTGAVKFSPIAPLTFKTQKQGTTSPPGFVTLTNGGNTALKITSMQTTGPFGATSNCGKSVPSKARCTISITFSPTSTGAFSGAVSINDSASSKPQVIVVSGNGN